MRPIVSQFFQIARHSNIRYSALLLLLLAAQAPRAFAGESQYKPPASHYYCTSNPAPNSRYYSGLFDAPASSDVEQQMSRAFQLFLSKKYRIDAPANCQGNPDQKAAQALMQQQITQLKNSNWKIIETGWTYSSAAQAAASGGGAQSAGASSAPAATPAAKGAYWICRIIVNQPAAVSYYSDVVGPFSDMGSGYNTLAKAFSDYAIPKYNLPKFSAPVCIDYGSNGEAQARAALRQFTSHQNGSKVVMTGWKYGM